MSKFTEKQRADIYRRSVKRIGSEVEFTCSAIQISCLHLFLATPSMSDIEELFPELFLFKDNNHSAFLSYDSKDVKQGDQMSGTTGGNKLRKIVLELCAEMCEQ